MANRDQTTRFYRELWPHRATVLRAALMLTRNANDADDLAQDAMLKAFAALDQLKPDTNSRAWLLAILRNAHLDRIRAAPVPGISLDQTDIEPAAPETTSPEDTSAWDDPDRMLDEFADEQLIAAMKSLPREICWTLLLVDVEGLDDRHAAEILQIPPGTVKSRLHRGRRMLREKLLPLARDRRIGTARKSKTD